MIVQEIRNELEKHSNAEEKEKRIRWEKQYQEKPKIYGIPAPIVRKISSRFFQKIKRKTKQEIIELGNDLLESGYSEEKVIAFDWAFRLRKLHEKSDFLLYEMWLTKHVHSWGTCDDLCTHALGALILQFPDCIHKMRKWTRSKNRWARRASAVSLIYSIRRKKHLRSIFETADALLSDPDKMVQKGYGWMLKEASNKYPEAVFDYVMKNKKEMPRTALRYAIEKLPPKFRREAMKGE
ncbi:MAG: DNA alkylation repair protein [Candidatus Bathyarchaeota archaeon]|nr:MAG: DNA alkylation repair protein [Candidatus Bathyarchaeota archaeon]UCD40325.1 MAG: DNA alkylation repair protein [Candidatus Bathyarchaeota archaeon]